MQSNSFEIAEVLLILCKGKAINKDRQIFYDFSCQSKAGMFTNVTNVTKTYRRLYKTLKMQLKTKKQQ